MIFLSEMYFFIKPKLFVSLYFSYYYPILFNSQLLFKNKQCYTMNPFSIKHSWENHMDWQLPPDQNASLLLIIVRASNSFHFPIFIITMWQLRHLFHSELTGTLRQTLSAKKTLCHVKVAGQWRGKVNLQFLNVYKMSWYWKFNGLRLPG